MRIALLLLLAACDVSRPVRVRRDAAVECPVVATETATAVPIEVGCGPSFCSATIAQDGCGLTLTTSCQPAVLTGSIDADGIAAFDGCTGTAGTDDVLLSIACESPRCDLVVHAPPQPAFESTSIAIVDREFRFPGGTLVQPLDQFDALTGYLSAMIIDGDRIAVAAPDDFIDFYCRGSVASQIMFLDLGSLAVTPGPAAPACVRGLVRTADGFAAVVAGPAVALFDSAWQLVRTVPLPVPEDGVAPIDLVFDGARAHALVGKKFGGRVFALDASWTITATSAYFAATVRGIEYDPGGRVAVSDLAGGRVIVLDPITLDTDGQIALVSTEPRKVADDAARILRFEDSLLVSSTGFGGGIWGLDQQSSDPIAGNALPYEHEAVPWAIVATDGRAAIGVMDRDLDAYVSAFDPRAIRFLPGETKIGRGSVSALAYDRSGALWAMLPWSGALARITPR